MHLFELPKNLALSGVEGQKWLAALPAQIEQISALWLLEKVRPLPNLSYNFVAEAEKDGQKCILKLAPDPGLLQRESAWYKATASSVLLDSTKNALLLRHLGPSLKSLVRQKQDDQASEILASYIQQHSTPATSGFPRLADCQKDFAALAGHFPVPLLARAQSIFRELTADQSRLLHADLHHDNLLADGTSWAAIDPHAFLGPQILEVGAMLRNPEDAYPGEPGEARKILDRRLEILAAHLPYSPKELRQAGLAVTLLSAAWCQGDTGAIPNLHKEVIAALATD